MGIPEGLNMCVSGSNASAPISVRDAKIVGIQYADAAPGIEKNKYSLTNSNNLANHSIKKWQSITHALRTDSVPIMFILANFLSAFATILDYLLTIYMFIIIARAVISWVNPDPYNAIVRFLYNVTEPVLYRVRRLIPLGFGGFDFSPIIVILVIVFAQRFIVNSLLQIAFRLSQH
jgi:YggT family protein